VLFYQKNILNTDTNDFSDNRFDSDSNQG